MEGGGEILAWCYSLLMWVGSAAGVYILLMFVWMLCKSCWKHHGRRRLNLLDRYGRKSWAVVTGASKGIGLSLCKELAKCGFNIVMIARSLDLMQSNAKVIQALYPIQVRCIGADLAAEQDSPYDHVLKSIQDLDVGIFVSNAGIMYNSRFAEVPMDQVLNIINLNMRTGIELITQMLERMRSRHKPRSAIIVTSSMTSMLKFPYLNLYAPSKAFLSAFVKRTQEDLANHMVDILLAEYGAVSSEMLPLPPIPGIIADSDSTASATLDTLGHDNQTYGKLLHDLQHWLLSSLGLSYLTSLFGRLSVTQFAQRLLQRNRKHKYV